MSAPKILVTNGRLGWANPDNNPLHSLTAYGPRSRWHDVRGDILGDHLSEEGLTEGSPFIVIASSSRFDSDLFDQMRFDLSQFVADWLTTHRPTGSETP